MSTTIEWPNNIFTKDLPLILASASPRRKELLQRLNLKFKVIPSHIEEKDIPGSPEEKARMWAFLKAESIAKQLNGIIIGADTIVVLQGEILGKPQDKYHAQQMLRQLSGNTHTVITGLAFINTKNNYHISRSVETKVTFRMLSQREIDAYIASKEPMDKAGAYGIQGKGANFVTHLEGCYTNVIGLPLSTVLRNLKKIVDHKGNT